MTQRRRVMAALLANMPKAETRRSLNAYVKKTSEENKKLKEEIVKLQIDKDALLNDHLAQEVKLREKITELETLLGLATNLPKPEEIIGTETLGVIPHVNQVMDQVVTAFGFKVPT